MTTILGATTFFLGLILIFFVALRLMAIAPQHFDYWSATAAKWTFRGGILILPIWGLIHIIATQT